MTSRLCSSCGETNPGDANWCEACGTDLDVVAAAPKSPCVSCSAAGVEITDDGWCQLCGTKQPVPEDHVVADHGWFAVVSDRGKVHRTNEDTGGVAARATGVVLVVCDGVSSTDQSQHASQTAVRTIIEMIEGAPVSSIDKAIVDAALAAQNKIIEHTTNTVRSDGAEPPSCTMVTVVAEIVGAQADLRLGWLGDSRAYWLANGTATQLTRDHSWATEQHADGALDRAAIDADPRAHSITRWLGADSHDPTPELAAVQVELPGTLLVCSDGLWNYTPTEADLYALSAAAGADEAAIDQAERLVAFANAQGGHDNITVAVAHLEPQSCLQPPIPTDNPGATHG